MGIMSIRRLSRTLLPGVVAILVVAMGAGLFFIGPKFGSEGPDLRYHGPAVRVNGITLKDKDFEENCNQIIQKMQQYGIYDMGIEPVREQALQIAIQQLVIRDQIKKNKISLPKDEVDKYFNKLVKQFPTKEEKESAYAQWGVKKDSDVKALIKPFLEEQWLYVALLKKKAIDVKVTAKEIADQYASITLSEITFNTQKDAKGALTEDQAKKKADEVYAKLQAGGDWNKLAKEYSMNEDNKNNGGSLGEINLASFSDQYGPVYGDAFVKAALDLKEGQYSAPVKGNNGYYLIRVDDRKDASGPEFKKEEPSIRANLVSQKFRADSEKFKKWIDARIAEANVTILDPALRAYQLKNSNKWAEAAKFYEQAVKSGKHKWDREIFISAAEVFNHEKQWDKAIAYTRKALKYYKADVDLQVALGTALYKRAKGKDKSEGLKMFETAITTAGDDTTSLTKVKTAYDELKLTKQSKALDARIKKILKDQAEEQARLQKQMEEEAKKQQASPSPSPSASPSPSPSPAPKK